jgi:hypothetical protein
VGKSVFPVSQYYFSRWEIVFFPSVSINFLGGRECFPLSASIIEKQYWLTGKNTLSILEKYYWLTGKTLSHLEKYYWLTGKNTLPPRKIILADRENTRSHLEKCQPVLFF